MDWVRFFEDNGVDYVTRSPNTKKGNVSIKCPWCGDNDPSEHLGVSLTKEAYGCWRDPEHSGKAPYRLIAALLGCSFTLARLTAAQYRVADPDGITEALASLTEPSKAPVAMQGHTEKLHLPVEFRRIERVGSTARFWRYLVHRGFDSVEDLICCYNLKCAVTGRWKDRIIIPIYQGSSLVSWTGRAIQNPVNAPRYLSGPDAIKRTVFNEDDLYDGGATLFVVEGPFDALKLDFYGQPLGVRACCVFGVNVTIDQISILNDVGKRFKQVVILFDDDAVGPAFNTMDWLHGKNVTMGQLPDGVKDAGQMQPRAVTEFIRKFL